jgi:ATPase involved in DNA repair-like protein
MLLAKIENLKSRYKALRDKVLVLSKQKELYLSDYKVMREKLRIAEQEISDYEAINAILECAQQAEHESTIGVYEKLLTALIEDTLDNNRKIKMNLAIERGMPALEIYSEKEEGKLEDIYSSNGGSINNIVSVGLRAISLIRSKKRRLLILDESDCWLKGDYIPKFGAVIQQLSERLGIQIVMISHHNEENFSDIRNKLAISRNGDTLKAEWKSSYGSEPPKWDLKDEGIRSLYLENFQSHKNTYIPLGKNVTLITGDNDIGKSVIVNALRAVFYGESNDTQINHQATETKVSVEFDRNKLLIWQRKLKGKPKVSYTLIDDKRGLDNPIHYYEGAKEVPDWVRIDFGIDYIDDLDVQLGHQKRPVFLLDEPNSKKAKSLAIGNSENYLFKMMELAKQDLKNNKDFVKRAREQLEILLKKSDAIDNVKMISIEDCDAKLEELAALEKKVNSKGELNNNIKELQSNQYQLKILSSLHQSSLPKSTLDLDMLYNSREVIEYVVNLSYNNLLATKLAKLNELKFDSSMIDIQQLNKRKETALLFVDMIKNHYLKTIFKDITLSEPIALKVDMELKSIVMNYLKALKEKSILNIQPLKEFNIQVQDQLYDLLNEYLDENLEKNVLNKEFADMAHELSHLVEFNIPHICPVCLQHVDDASKLNINLLK